MIRLRVDPSNPDMKAVRVAADAIRKGELVIFPTETVYGLAADALNKEAVKRVYDAKGRRDHQPLPVQVGSIEDVFKAAEFMSPDARRLAEMYWPGPLTLVLTKSAALPSIVTGGRETVGVRVPDHPVALALVKAVGSPIVATSANLTGNPPPKTATQAIRDVGENVTVVLDGGQSRFGVASTVVDMTVSPPKILRRGSLDVNDVRKVLGEVEE